MTLRQLADWVKTRLGIETLRVVGDLDMTCQGIALLPGCPGRNAQIGALAQPEVDVVITGEISEWETSEYVRDATRLGQGKGLLVLGHAASEEPGMRWVTPWLQARLPGIDDPFRADRQAVSLGLENQTEPNRRLDVYQTDMYEGMLAETVIDPRRGRGSHQRLFRPAAGAGAVPGHGRDPPHARLGRVVPGGHAQVRRPRLRRALSQSLLPRRPRHARGCGGQGARGRRRPG